MSMAESEAAERPAAVEPVRPEPGRLGRWVRADQVRAVAIALIVVSVAWRAAIADRGYFSQDEYVIAAQAIDTRLTADFLFVVFNNHLMPGGMLAAWLMVRVDGLAAWPWVLMLTVLQAAVSVAFYGLLRAMLRPGWAMLVPLCMFLFSPLTLEATSLWVVGLLMLPIQLAVVLAVAAQLRYARTGHRRWVVGLVLAVAFGLAFDTKALLIVPLLFVLTAFLFCEGRAFASVWQATRRFWPGWLALTALCAGYLAFYLTRPPQHLNRPGSPGDVVGFVVDLVGRTLVPGLVGGPWEWMNAGDGPPLVRPPDLGVWLAWAVLLVVVVATVRRRASAPRAWLLLLTYVVMVTVLFAVTRLGGTFGPLAGLVPRYVSDVVVVAALCVGVALLGLRDRGEPDVGDWPVPAVLREPGAFAVGLVAAIVLMAAVGLGNLWSISRFDDNWSTKYGRDYLTTAQAALASAPPGTTLVEDIVPERVVAGYFWPDNLQSHFFRAAPRRPVFVTQAAAPSMFDDAGHIRPATVEGQPIVPAPEGCGHEVSYGTLSPIPLEKPVVNWPWWVHFGYLSSGETTVTFQLGSTTQRIDAHNGLNEIYFRLEGGGDAVQLSVNTPGVTVCTRLIVIGKLVPKTS